MGQAPVIWVTARFQARPGQAGALLPLLRDLAAKADRHLILVTATPHSGDEGAFRSLLGLLDKAFVNLPPDLTGGQYENIRRHIASHFIQRRRGDILHYLGANTHFPERLEAEENYRLSGEYRKLFARVISYVQQSIRDGETSQHRQRVRWWSALALLRSIASSPAAASARMAASSDGGAVPPMIRRTLPRRRRV